MDEADYNSIIKYANQFFPEQLTVSEDKEIKLDLRKIDLIINLQLGKKFSSNKRDALERIFSPLNRLYGAGYEAEKCVEILNDQKLNDALFTKISSFERSVKEKSPENTSEAKEALYKKFYKNFKALSNKRDLFGLYQNSRMITKENPQLYNSFAHLFHSHTEIYLNQGTNPGEKYYLDADQLNRATREISDNRTAFLEALCEFSL